MTTTSPLPSYSDERAWLAFEEEARAFAGLPPWSERPQRPASVPESLGYDDDSKARLDALLHPCGRCGQREGAGAAGLCMDCNELAEGRS